MGYNSAMPEPLPPPLSVDQAVTVARALNFMHARNDDALDVVYAALESALGPDVYPRVIAALLAEVETSPGSGLAERLRKMCTEEIAQSLSLSPELDEEDVEWHLGWRAALEKVRSLVKEYQR